MTYVSSKSLPTSVTNRRALYTKRTACPSECAWAKPTVASRPTQPLPELEAASPQGAPWTKLQSPIKAALRPWICSLQPGFPYEGVNIACVKFFIFQPPSPERTLSKLQFKESQEDFPVGPVWVKYPALSQPTVTGCCHRRLCQLQDGKTWLECDVVSLKGEGVSPGWLIG